MLLHCGFNIFSPCTYIGGAHSYDTHSWSSNRKMLNCMTKFYPVQIAVWTFALSSSRMPTSSLHSRPACNACFRRRLTRKALVCVPRDDRIRRSTEPKSYSLIQSTICSRLISQMYNQFISWLTINPYM